MTTIRTLTWGVRLTIYSFVDTHSLLSVITNLSKKERKYLQSSHIAGKRSITIDLPTDAVYRKSQSSSLSLFVSLSQTLELRIGTKTKWLLKDRLFDRLANFILSLPEEMCDRKVSVSISKCYTCA